jgi:hypothetical protein
MSHLSHRIESTVYSLGAGANLMTNNACWDELQLECIKYRGLMSMNFAPPISRATTSAGEKIGDYSLDKLVELLYF